MFSSFRFLVFKTRMPHRAVRMKRNDPGTDWALHRVCHIAKAPHMLAKRSVVILV